MTVTSDGPALAASLLAEAESLGAAEAMVQVEREHRVEERWAYDGSRTEREGQHRTITVSARVGTGWATAVAEGAAAAVAANAIRAARMLRDSDDAPLRPAPGVPGPFGDATGSPLSPAERAQLITLARSGPASGEVLGVEYIEATSHITAVRTGAVPVSWAGTRRQLWHWTSGIGGNHLEGSVTWGQSCPDPLLLRAIREDLMATRTAEPAVPADQLPLLVTPGIAMHLIDLLASALNGRNAASGMRALLGKVDRQIAPPFVTVVDDGRLSYGPYGAAVDDEGTPTARNALVDRGVLRGFLHSVDTAQACRHPANGCAVRSFPGGPIGPGVRGFQLLAGHSDHAALRSQLNEGMEAVAVTRPAVRVDGGKKIRLEVCGWLVGNGQRVRPVGPVRVEVGLFGWLRAVRGCGDQVLHSALFRGLAAPSVLLSSASVGPA